MYFIHRLTQMQTDAKTFQYVDGCFRSRAMTADMVSTCRGTRNARLGPQYPQTSLQRSLRPAAAGDLHPADRSPSEKFCSAGRVASAVRQPRGEHTPLSWRCANPHSANHCTER